MHRLLIEKPRTPQQLLLYDMKRSRSAMNGVMHLILVIVHQELYNYIARFLYGQLLCRRMVILDDDLRNKLE